jgi:anti-sigma factor RsiW
MWRIAAAVALSLGIGAAGGWLLHLQPAQDRAALAMSLLQHEALASHSVYATDVNHPIEMAGSERDHLVHWLSGRLNRTVVPPDLSEFGYRLIGGRLLATEQGHPAALFMYEDSSGNRISLVMRPMAPEFHVAREDSARDDVNLSSWIAGGMGYAVLGKASDAELDRIARQIGSQRS